MFAIRLCITPIPAFGKASFLEAIHPSLPRVISEQSGRRSWKESDLLIHCQRDPAKPAIAARLRQETTLSVKTIAGRMHLGISKSANAHLYGWMCQSVPVASAPAQAQLGM
jgi:hypothetical protein